ncbi:MAG: rhodanese-like domain-containing protein [Desulfomonile tiedjei]|nr:rhodanese-like domain-containing protein [Desulfomonile tiedjei]
MMKACFGVALRAMAILLLWSSVGISLNLFSANAIPWVYVPPPDLEISGVKIPLIDEKEARKLLDDPSVVFVDTRTAKDYAKSTVKGAQSLPRKEMEERFILIQPLLPEEARLVLFCYGPQCEDAERVAEFLIPMGYRNLVIMSPGFPGWEKAGYPVDSGPDKELGGKQPDPTSATGGDNSGPTSGPSTGSAQSTRGDK